VKGLDVVLQLENLGPQGSSAEIYMLGSSVN
jgi:hypothetical protein